MTSLGSGNFTYDAACIYLTEVFCFINQYNWISNSYVAEFFVQDLWHKLPLKWQICLESLTLEDVANGILKPCISKHQSVWPLSLLSFVKTCQTLALNRTQCKYLDSGEVSLQELNGIFKKHIKPKKRHELAILPAIINSVCEKTKSTHVVDVGSGLGHLSRMLAYRYGLNITAVEMAGQRLPVAEKFDKEIVVELNRINVKDGVDHIHGEVNHVAKMISPEITTDEFLDLINSGKPKEDLRNEFTTKDVDSERYVLVGLHTCGDLASTMLKVFQNTRVIKGLVSVSCCYFRMTLNNQEDVDSESMTEKNCVFSSNMLRNLLSEKLNARRTCSTELSDGEYTNVGEDTGPNKSINIGFPLSRFLQTMPFQPLKYKSFETACHFVDDYAKKMLAGSPNLKLHCYRAVMEVFIRHVDPTLILTSIRCKKIKNAADMTFLEYAKKVFERLGKKLDPVLLDEVNYTDLLSQWKNVAVYHSLTLLLGPVIESIALMDKWMFLYENGIDASITPVFDASLSPRNFVLVSTRT